jgi:hypothetical protein
MIRKVLVGLETYFEIFISARLGSKVFFSTFVG